jgi:acetyl/propionyl-CoA carboxylase alpha subunit/acetyl-CoA carboxylase carboxyltransferase component
VAGDVTPKRVAIFDRGETARRVLSALRELGRAGRQMLAIAIRTSGDRRARFASETDEAIEASDSVEESLRRSRADVAWLGASPLPARAAFAEACERRSVAFVGPPASVLRRLCEEGELARLASQVDLSLAGPESEAGSRRIEVVVARDRQGAARALGVGDATIRRGEQPLLVESPSSALSVAQDAAVRDLALRLCELAGWIGICAVRLRYHPESRRLSLIELAAFAESAPALEAVVLTDLVLLQLRLAAGELLNGEPPAGQAHAIAARIYAEGGDEIPAAARIVELLRLPSRLGVRADWVVEQGDEAPLPSHAPIATLVARGHDHAQAADRIEQALADADVFLRGTFSSRARLLALCALPKVQNGSAGEDFVQGVDAAGQPELPDRSELALVAAAIEEHDAERERELAGFLAEARRGRPRVASPCGHAVELRVGDRRHRLQVREIGPREYRVAPVGGAPLHVSVERIGWVEWRLTCDGERSRVLSASDGRRRLLEVNGVPCTVMREPAGVVPSPMPAVVVALAVEAGQGVAEGDLIARLESMKLEAQVTAPFAGIVREVLVATNAHVDRGTPLVRIDPLADAAVSTDNEPLRLRREPSPAATSLREQWSSALAELRNLLLGFDVTPSESRQLAATLRALCAGAPLEDAQVAAAMENSLAAFADIQSLFSRTRSADEELEPRPPVEEMWRYLRDVESHGAHLAPAFVEKLHRALSHYGASLDDPGRELTLALLRIWKAQQRAEEQVAALVCILEHHLSAAGPLALSSPSSRELLDRLAEVGRGRFAALTDLARELRYQRFDEPVFARARSAAYAQAEVDIDRLTSEAGNRREALVRRLVDCPYPLATQLIARMGTADPEHRPHLVETLLRRYYRFRSLQEVRARQQASVPCAAAQYEHRGARIWLAAGFAPRESVAKALAELALLANSAPADCDLAIELYLLHQGALPPPDNAAESLRAALERAGLSRRLRRATFAIACPQSGIGAASPQHFVFRGGPGEYLEDRHYRGFHPMLFHRIQLGWLSGFDLERLPSAEDVYLYRGVARTNPKDERLLAVAEVRDLTPVRDAQGRVVQLPQLERMVHEALAAMRHFQARREPGKRLVWNRVLLTLGPPLELSPSEIRGIAERLAPDADGMGLEMVLISAQMKEATNGGLRPVLIKVVPEERAGFTISYGAPTDEPLEPMAGYHERAVKLRRRGLVHPFEVIRLLAPAAGSQSAIPPGDFMEHDLDGAGALVPVDRLPGGNSANVVVGVVRNFTARYPDGMRRVVLLGDPGRELGALAEPECRRICAAIDLARRLGAPIEWFAVSAGAKISMSSGTENMDWIARVLRRIVEFTQAGGEINVVVTGVNAGAQPYWNAEATMLMHTRGILIMTPGSAMVLTGKQALDYSGSISAEDNLGIGGYDHVMGPNGQAQYEAKSLGQACQILLCHYEHCYVAPGERFPRRAETSDARERDVRSYPHGGCFASLGEVFSDAKNPDRKKPFDVRRVMAAVIDQDHPPLERWRGLRGGETAIVWDAHLGGWPVCLIGIESHPLHRLDFVPGDGPEVWTAGTLFPQSSKKMARAINSASGNRPMVVLANLSGFDGSPESMRRLQLEYGAEIGRAVVNFDGPIVFCVISRYHGGAFVVFSKALRENMEVFALEGSKASVIGGAPAAAVVLSREVEMRTARHPKVIEAERAVAEGAVAEGALARARLAEVTAAVRSAMLGQVGEDFDRVHTVQRALKVGSLDRIISPAALRPHLIDAVERGIARSDKR